MQLIWLIDFIKVKEPKIGKTVIPTILNSLHSLWIRIDKIFSSYHEKEIESIDSDVLLHSICPVIRMYHKIVFSFSSSNEDEEEKYRILFQTFIDNYHLILWKIINDHGSKLIDELDFALFTPSIHWNRRKLNLLLTFKQQREWLNKQILELQRKFSDENITITVKRDSIGENSCSSLLVGGGHLFKGKFNIVFDGEEGSGAGVRREWFDEISKELFDPNNALFLFCHDGTLQPNPHSGINNDHLSYFRFAGRVIALAIYHSVSNEILLLFYSILVQMNLKLDKFIPKHSNSKLQIS